MQHEEHPTKPPLSMTEAVIPLASLIVLVALSYYLFGDAGAGGPNQVALMVATMVAAVIGIRHGLTLDEMRDAAVASVGTGLGAIFILLAVGALVGTWAMSGTIAAMVYYGLQLLSPHYFYATALVICGVISFSIGSSWTTVGTIGIGLMGISSNMDMNPAITAGAVISGAYFGDKSSPLSDSANLAAAAAGVDLYKHIRETLLTSMVALAISLLVFLQFGRPGEFDASQKMMLLKNAFNISLLLFLPLASVIVLALCRVPAFTSIFLGALIAAGLAAVVAPERVVAFAQAREGIPRALALLKGMWLALASGYRGSTGVPAVDLLVTRGGMESMMNTIWLIIAALGFGGVVERCGVLERLMAPILAKAKSAGALVAALAAAIFGTAIATADQYMAVMLPGRSFKTAFEQRGLAPVVLSRTIGDVATPTSALIPWNSCGAYMAATLGVATFSYAPFAVFCIASPLLAIVMAYCGIRMPRVPAAGAGASSAG
ncbi:Na+/H+ antiporter NhaC [Variovorax sp. YR216]|uniref:Na+/H+ antiporter NhaC n=1 Tax=Variovorax sp. YR216 TaxID=1882828 RepID=UPI0008998837|nr:Na+/H+ antiporter NhaC [Variovorax sp. YR216]SEB21339.1 transporter, NhaC family [Variovorax sp. YR216]